MEIGVDIINLDRIHLDHMHFVKRILTEKEYDIFIHLPNEKRKREYLGGRFAGKEAYMKALKKGIGELDFQSIEILNHEDGSPYLHDSHAKISISHEDHYAVAFVVIE